MTQISILLFAQIREMVGSDCLSVCLPDPVTIGEAVAWLKERYPDIEATLGSCMFARNEEYCEDIEDIMLSNGDELAVIPPVSGG